MKIDRRHVEEAFKQYVSDYDVSDVKVRLKVDHTYRVAQMCDAITIDLRLTPADRDFAWLSGMLHDIGRFEQLRRYDTFVDSRSCNHAALSVDILFHEGVIRQFVEKDGAAGAAAPDRAERDRAAGAAALESVVGETEPDSAPEKSTANQAFVPDLSSDEYLLDLVIRLHNVYKLPENLSEREYLFATVLRDADKIDILRVNRETPVTEIYDLPEEAFRTASISDEVFQDVMSHQNVNRAHSKTAIDFIVGHIAFVFGLVYPESFRQVRDQGCLAQMLAFPSDNPDTQKKMKKIAEEVEKYMDEKIESTKYH